MVDSTPPPIVILLLTQLRLGWKLTKLVSLILL